MSSGELKGEMPCCMWTQGGWCWWVAWWVMRCPPLCRLRLLWWEIVAAAVTYAFAALKDYPQNGEFSGDEGMLLVLLFGTKLLLQVKFLIIFQSTYTYIYRKRKGKNTFFVFSRLGMLYIPHFIHLSFPKSHSPRSPSLSLGDIIFFFCAKINHAQRIK